MKIFFKWSGGKSRELKKLLPLFPESWSTYYEPFIGGGAVWLNLETKKAIINDNYEDVINFYQVLKKNPEKLLNKLNSISKEYNAIEKNNPAFISDENPEGRIPKEEFRKIADKYYYNYREQKTDDEFEKAVKFYILRQLSFSGMLRFNVNGDFNVPFGWYKKLKLLNHDTKKVKEVLDNTTIMCGNWKESLKTATKNDFVFLDPPYTRVFQKYHPNGQFGEKEHIELCDWFKSKKAKSLIIINQDNFTHSLYKDYIVKSHEHKYSIQFRDRMKKEDSLAKHIIAINY